MQRAASTARVAARGGPYKEPFQLGARPISISTPSAPCPCSMLSTAPSPPSTAPPLSECSSIAECGAILSNAPHLAQSTSLFTTAGDASASDSRASPFSAGVGRIAAAASTAAAKRSIARRLRHPLREPSPLCTTARRDKQPRVFRRARTACHQESVQQRSQRAPQQYERRHGDVQRV